MAYTVIKCEVGGSTSQGYYYEYLCESADDVANLPTGADSADITRPAPGSLARIEGDLSIYLLQNNREWSEVMSGSGGGGGGGGYDAVIRLDTQDAGSTWTGTVESGTFEAIQAKAEAGEMFSVGAYWRNQNETDLSIGDVANRFYTNYVPAPLTGTIAFDIFMKATTTGELSDYNLLCSWDSDGTITIEQN